MHTFCRLSFLLIQAVQTLMSLHAYQFCALQTFCRPRADIKQSNCVSLLCSSATGGGPSPLSVVAAAALEGEAAVAAAAAFEGEAAATAVAAAAAAAAGRCVSIILAIGSIAPALTACLLPLADVVDR